MTGVNAEWENRIVAAQRGIKLEAKAHVESVQLNEEDFSKLVNDRAWLNDNCVAAPLLLAAFAINNAAGIKFKVDPPKVVTLNTFFFQQLLKSVANKERMLKRTWGLTPQNFLDVETIVVPICSSSHWNFVLIRPSRREIAFVDSFHKTGEVFLDKVTEFIKAFLGSGYKEEEWKTVHFRVPSQHNGYDCGMFTITNAVYIALGIDPSNYKEPDLRIHRQKIAAILLNGGFTGEFDLSEL
ncbi:uncharacterized protein BCR38DRAFT_343254 [Pseudomassariella vexata]|uniref:Ubiquitin-like protease family profile domain-containing protein n=1 Tax=Pseudomassariella vexata TaxID=1141098 RepID=A0A1Y2DYN5_9PEZI|nr:uncharacterized protein BCR38DRAFT_343254 [Pseudomassariella vexata]ORY64216.1 hypothetical protein BCR38DRAFT_343254 [Pseudomassariella vexata]